jgi:integrase
VPSHPMASVHSMTKPGDKTTGSRARRGAGEGAVYKRADGLWVGAVELGRDPKTGKRLRKVVKAKTKTETETLRKFDEARKRATSGRPAIDHRQTTGAYLTWWLDNVLPGQVKDSTAAGYRTVVESYVRPHVDTIPLAKLQPAHVQTMMRSLENDGKSPRTRQYARAVLRRALGHAMRLDMIGRNVAALVESPKGAETKLDDALTTAESRKVLDTAAGTFAQPPWKREHDRLEALYVLALSLGLRRGELLGLRWSDIDLGDDQPSLTVARTLTRITGQGLVLSTPKTDAGARTVPLVGACQPALLAHRERQDVERHAAGVIWQETGFVFTTPQGQMIDPANVLHRWQLVTQRAGLGKRRLHASRHTAATVMLDQGVPLEVVSAVMGHASLSITADVYARPTMDSKRRGLSALAAALK